MSAPFRAVTCDRLYYGVYPAIVEEVGASKHPGEVRLSFPWFDPGMKTEWCRVCNLYAGNGYGSFFHPEQGDEVLVSFMQGDMRWPIVLGGLYNGQDQPPTARTAERDQKLLRTKGKHELLMDDTSSGKRVRITSSSGHTIDLDDAGGQEKIVIRDKNGNNKLVIDVVAGSITITAQQTLTLDAHKIEIKAKAGIDITAGATMNLKGATINLN